ncbi:MAG: ACP phosphodiesterase [Cytophagales bacterium]|nr:ACP phosphodiesterase [Bernardetiaceae bacterium]MDW8206066.1 ACP phosphodiesterase [Cytophagales bacterium]
MNFLAHLALAAPQEGLLIGNFIADHVKGNRWQAFAPSIQAGILLHRAIDYFADTHPIARQSTRRLQPRYRLYAGVIVDVFYDHFLAASWEDYVEMPLSVFSQSIYALMQQHYDMLPVTSQLFLQYARQHDILVGYASLETIGRVLQGMARRLAKPAGIETAIEELLLYYDDFAQEFAQFWQAIVVFVHQEKTKLQASIQPTVCNLK